MSSSEQAAPPALTVIDPQGNRTRQELGPFPFRIGRQSDNQLILRDARISRNHAQVVGSGTEFMIEDLGSRHGVYVNSRRVGRQVLHHGDQVDFGFGDSYTLIWDHPASKSRETAGQTTAAALSTLAVSEGNLAGLRAVLEIVRGLERSFSLETVLGAVVDGALAITGADRGFLLMTRAEDLEICAARNRAGPISKEHLRVPRTLIRKALEERRDTFSMQFDPEQLDEKDSAYDLELKSVVCVPLVRIRLTTDRDVTRTGAPETIGVLYLDSRREQRDMTVGNREMLQTLAVEASAVIENARLLEEERARQHIEEEHLIAQRIQQSLLPGRLPDRGWLRAAGTSRPSRQAGGDYFDLLPLSPNCFALVIADAAGKGVSAALVASLLQGACLALDPSPPSLHRTLDRVNRFFRDRSQGQKHATLFCGLIHRSGHVAYISAGHCSPALASTDGAVRFLPSTSPPVGLLDDVSFRDEQFLLSAGDRLVLYSDGITEARNARGEFFGRSRLLACVRTHHQASCSELHAAIIDAVAAFTSGHEPDDDQTLVVLEWDQDGGSEVTEPRVA